MAFASTSLRTLVSGGPGASMHVYSSTEPSTVISAANYFTNPQRVGLTLNDTVIVRGPSGRTTLHSVTALTTATTPYAGDDVATISSTS